MSIESSPASEVERNRRVLHLDSMIEVVIFQWLKSELKTFLNTFEYLCRVKYYDDTTIGSL